MSVKTEHYKVRANLVGCTLKTYARMFRFTSPHIRVEDQFYWNNCVCNEFDGLTRRHLLGPIAGYDPANPELKALETTLKVMSSEVPQFGPVSHEVLMANTRSTIKKRYRMAYYNLRQKVVNVGSREAQAKAFVKYEKIPIGKFESGKPPRLIQFRDFTYLYSLKKQVLGHSLAIKSGDIKWFDQPAKSIFTKVHDSYGIAQVMFESWKLFANPVAVCLDHSKFDGHYCKELLELEHEYWMRLNNSEFLERLLQNQLVNRGRTVKGLRYRVRGTRLSGEFTTSEGNSVMNYAMLRTWLNASGIKNFRIHVNGDDSVVMMEHDDLQKLLPLDYFRNFNMETECDRIVTDFRLISYCQASPIRVQREGQLVWYMVKDPHRTISRMQYSDSKFLQCPGRYMAGVGLCELAVNSGVPILQALSCLLIMQGRPLGSVDKFPALYSGNLSEVKPIHWQTRIDFEYTFGITPGLQHEIETAIAGQLGSPTDLNLKLAKYRNFILN